jgi:hypothetical protein
MATIRPLPDLLAIKAVAELNEVPDRIASDLATIKQWLAKSPHIRARTGEFWKGIAGNFNKWFDFHRRSIPDDISARLQVQPGEGQGEIGLVLYDQIGAAIYDGQTRSVGNEIPSHH